MIKRIQNYTFDDIKAGILELLDLGAHSEIVRGKAVEIVSGKPDPISAVYDWVKQNVSYISDPVDIELFTSPEVMIHNYNQGMPIGEDCDGHAILVTALLRAVGIPAHVVLVDTAGMGIDHAITTAYAEGLNHWIYVDTTSSYPLGWQYTTVREIVI